MSLSRIGLVVDSCIAQIPGHHLGVTVDCAIVMPNHLHAVLFLGEGVDLGVVVGTLKAAASRAAGRPLWQRSYHDHVIRDEADLTRLREYVATNPLRWGLDRS